MTSIRSFFIVLSFVSALPFMSFAQEKIGYVNSQELLLTLPERAHIQAKLEQFGSLLEEQFKRMTTEYEKRIAEYQNLPPDTPEAIRTSKANGISDLEKNITEFQQGSEKAILEHEKELLKPLIDKVQNAINAVAKREKYVHVFDTASALVYPEKSDFTELVKQELSQ